MNIDWNVVATGLLAPVAVLIVKTILDFKLAPLFVKYFWWIPVRGMFRSKPINISGKWEQIWESAGSLGFSESSDRHSHPVIRQFGNYCYTEFQSKSKTYVVFGKIINDYLVGDWYDINDSNGYFGAFQLQIVDSNSMKGRWIGHSKTKHEVKGDEWTWSKMHG
jgi:hypothetical protein